MWEETRGKKGSAASLLSELPQHCPRFPEKLASPCRRDALRQLWSMSLWDLVS